MQPATSRDLLAWLVGRRERFHVRGRSMAPELPDGTTVLVKRTAPSEHDIVVARLPADGQVVVKRVQRIEPDGRFFLRGDGEVTTDSRDYGTIPADSILGVVVSTFP